MENSATNAAADYTRRVIVVTMREIQGAVRFTA
jgi:hypothetical protein